MTDGARHHLAQLNVAAIRAPLDDPSMADFVDNLTVINALGEASPGFVWRLQDDAGNATSIRAFADPDIIPNLTVWESVEALKAFAYRSDHGAFFRRRAEWFRSEGRGLVLWWVPAGHLPDMDEGKERLDFLRVNGPSPFVFSMATVRAPLDIEPSALGDPVASELLTELNAELSALYPESGANHFRLEPDDVAPGRGEFLVARLDGEPVGCGAVRLIMGGKAEIERVYVRGSARGSKIGAAVLRRLEGIAVALGAERAVLETGTRQDAALGLYARAGYHRVPCAGDVVGVPTRVCLEKSLGQAG